MRQTDSEEFSNRVLYMASSQREVGETVGVDMFGWTDRLKRGYDWLTRQTDRLQTVFKGDF